MNNQIENTATESIISILDIFVIILLKDDPLIFIVFLILLKAVTKDSILRISFILLTIAASDLSY
ncbi:hypothetical protein [Cytobacillus horneckiae]|uniref:hypothetical protein n=1 Tax=Cytobacillus horneckiae TaxID=549687 RepID=UPI00204215E2|nr:hypothetical protein [Cytobacillus horneckiae]MCM3178109.1 hypothetical protein [Cytobacillus horneckiae]